MRNHYAGVAQLVELHLAKVVVASSSLVSRFFYFLHVILGFENIDIRKNWFGYVFVDYYCLNLMIKSMIQLLVKQISVLIV